MRQCSNCGALFLENEWIDRSTGAKKDGRYLSARVCSYQENVFECENPLKDSIPKNSSYGWDGINEKMEYDMERLGLGSFPKLDFHKMAKELREELDKNE